MISGDESYKKRQLTVNINKTKGNSLKTGSGFHVNSMSYPGVMPGGKKQKATHLLKYAKMFIMFCHCLRLHLPRFKTK